MTALNFLLTRAFARTLAPGDEVLVTRLDHDANVAPWLEIQHDTGLTVRFVDVTDELGLDYDDLERKLSDKTRVVAFPAAANSVGTAPDIRRVVDLAHAAGALAWIDAVHYGPHGPIDVADWGCDVLICSPYKFFGPHMGMAFGREELLRSWRPYKVRPAADEPVGRRFELGTCQHELLAGLVAAIDYVDSLGWEAMVGHERDLGQRFLDGLPGHVTLHGLPTMEGRVPTFCFSVGARSARSVAEHLASREIAVWWGNYYALETIRHLGLDEHDGAVRAGIVHYNTTDEIDRLLAGPHGARLRLLLLGGPKFLGRAVIDAALGRGHEVTLFNRGTTGADLYPELQRITGDRDGGLDGLRGGEWDAVVDTSGYVPRIVGAGAELLAASVPHYVFVSSISVYASFAEVVDESAPLAERLGARLRERRAGLRGAQGALRGGRRGGVPRTLHRRPRRPDRRPLRPDRPVHVLAAPDRPGRRRCSSRGLRGGSCSSSTCATSRPGSLPRPRNGSRGRSTRRGRRRWAPWSTRRGA